MLRHWRPIPIGVFVLLLAHAVASGPAPGPERSAIVGVSLLSMLDPGVRPDQTVVVEGDRIVAAGPRSEIALPPDTRVIAGQGRFLMPGLIDMHVHVRRADLNAYVAAGITSVRNMWGYSALPETLRLIAAGELVGPSIYSASPGIDGGPPQWPETQRLEDPELADALVAEQVRAGWLFVKVYQGLRADVYDAVLAACRRHGIRAIGHVATAVPLEHALAAGQLGIEHLSGYERALSGSPATSAQAWLAVDTRRMPELAQRTREAGAWNCPTLAIYQELAARSGTPAERDTIVRNRGLMLRALHAAGARLLAGTDSGIDVVPAGASLPAEIGAFVAAGVPPLEALRAATSDAAEFLGLATETGRIAPGMRADLLLLAADPLADVAALAAPVGVCLRGRWVDPTRP